MPCRALSRDVTLPGSGVEGEHLLDDQNISVLAGERRQFTRLTRTGDAEAEDAKGDDLPTRRGEARPGRREELSHRHALGPAYRFMPFGHGRADYLLFVDHKAFGAVEAKPSGTPLAGVEWQSAKGR